MTGSPFSTAWKTLLFSVALLTAPALSALNVAGELGVPTKLSDLKEIKADKWLISGGNIIVKGNVHVPFGALDIYADEAVVNIENRDLEATGNLMVYSRNSASGSVTPSELVKLQRMAGVLVTVNGISTSILGEQRIKVSVSSANDNIRARKLSGNLVSGYLEINDVSIRFRNFVARAGRALRKPSGELEIRDAEISTCEYLEGENSHYSIWCGKAVLTPHDVDAVGLKNFDPDRGEYTVWGYNCTWRFYGVPVFWMPVLYKPKDESPGLFKFQVGRNGDYGVFARFSKKFDMTDYPYSNAKLLLDYYQFRGFGYGADVNVQTENSKTAIFGYGIYDQRPYYSSDVEGRRLEIPHMRYDFSITNVTHITPSLDFRGTLNMSSDYYMRRDYENYSFNNNPEPGSFMALEKQFDRFSAALYLSGQVNRFYTTVEKVPEFRIDIPRQQIFGTNFYYQGETSIAYMQMKWRKWDTELPDWVKSLGFDDPKNYETARFDSLHFIYFPINLDWINIIPRAGVRFTDYSRSSRERISSDDLSAMFFADSINGSRSGVRKNYDSDGGNRFRVVGEFGFEAKTKLYSSWQNVRNSFLQLDGLRHVIEPYTNYTFIPKPTVDRDYIYAFDDIDRIDRENFVRFGLYNRLQTRSGNSIREYFSMENYWDFHLQKSDGFNHIGDFCTKLTLMPFRGFSTSMFFSIDAGGNSTDMADTETTRRGRTVGRPGLNINRLNRLSWEMKYSPAEGYDFSLRYEYQNNYRTQSVYSMGSSLSVIEGGSAFDKYYIGRTQTLTFGMAIPLTPDRKTKGRYSVSYDFEAGYVTSQRFGIVRTLHCWEVALEYQISNGYDSDGDKSSDHSFMITAYLTGLTGPLQQAQSSFIGNSRRAMSGDGMF